MKELNIISATLALSLALHACNPFDNPSSAKAASLEPTKTFPHNQIVVPTFTPEIPIAENCIMPFPEARWDTGLRFLDLISEHGKPVRTDDGGYEYHLGWDFEGTRGEAVVSVCDGTLVFSGKVPGNYSTLGNVAIIKYTYINEDGVFETVYARYAHMENVIDLPPNSVILKGQKIGEVGSSGGWRQAHLHLDIWPEKTWNTQLWTRTINGDIAKMAGDYPGKRWDEGQIKRDLKNPKEWLFYMMGQ